MKAAISDTQKPRRSQADIREYRRISLMQAALVIVGKYDIETATVVRILNMFRGYAARRTSATTTSGACSTVGASASSDWN